MNEFISALRKYVVFSGRANRKEYWTFWLVSVILYILAFMLDTYLDHSIIVVFLGLFLLLPTLSITSRRLHDVGVPGWLSIFTLLPFVWLVMLYALVKKGDDGDNKYGKHPLI
ncbi:DUF805 domain-containing protein [Parabacteroides sp. AF48-14]|uniref:DUF805 domain-containing protein n=1 Tax=Parabacteroides sp. AF48-14 TaxID=2292052 RepID=UPI000EFEC239|nr:DUF805 domain-containing protein [Parabacteroides sp. AF48-14]RHO75306.1 DUF805 domain-containing protein [Parabacteroides sp. AF48-14]